MASTTWSDLPFELHLEMMHRLTQFDRYFFSQASWACRQLAEFPPKFSRPRLDPALVSHVFAQGYLSQLIWLKEHRVPFSDVAWHEAARNGRLEIFKWAHSNGETFFGQSAPPPFTLVSPPNSFFY